ncbi:exocyst complex component 6B-like [Manacus vitellinus]|uniref:exocyst complex component 6B-like n=1 Tax=Manacus vitellinus TaxID=328815 RepID=UPI00115C4F08|nr:exocyst complex component 6B-like [Manacus vitellinus]
MSVTLGKEINVALGNILFASEADVIVLSDVFIHRESTCHPTVLPESAPPPDHANDPLPKFARSGPVPGFQGDTLQLAFIDLRQLLDLFIQWDWSTYLADYGQPTCKYLRVNPTTALVLLEKMRDTSRKNNVFAQFRKNERDKQKLIDTVAKQLRGLINSHHS